MADGETDETGSADAFPYATAEAFCTALKARFTAIARTDPGYRLDELHRQFAYDRVLARCFTGEDRGRWVLKGAGALLARLPGAARHSKDIDLYYAEQAAAEEAVDALRPGVPHFWPAMRPPSHEAFLVIVGGQLASLPAVAFLVVTVDTGIRDR